MDINKWLPLQTLQIIVEYKNQKSVKEIYVLI